MSQDQTLTRERAQAHLQELAEAMKAQFGDEHGTHTARLDALYGALATAGMHVEHLFDEEERELELACRILAQPSGLPSGMTVNGFFAALQGGSASDAILRRIKVGVRAGASVPTSQQWTIGLYLMTVAPAGTGFSTKTGTNLRPNGPASAISGFIITTAAAAGTTGPTLGTQIDEFSFNTQSSGDLPWEMLEELWVPKGTANGLALVNLGNALPASHLFTVSPEWEE